jgi:hypothetical protein
MEFDERLEKWSAVFSPKQFSEVVISFSKDGTTVAIGMRTNFY